ncbi:MAG: diacylglycerol kinase family protein [Sphingobacteriaceae bacterium]|nr:MAG: diacylglycerol kinase family protein [Sphingobacteriaceae bacterium]
MKKILLGFGYAFKGIKYAYTTQVNFKIHSVAAVLTITTGVLLNISVNEWLWIALAIMLVVVAEMLNTAIEILTDLASPEWSEKAGRVKDLSAGAVVIVAAFALVSGLVIFLPKLYLLLTHAA